MTAEERVKELEAVILSVVSQRADNLCWMDVYVTLGKLVGMPVTVPLLAMLPTEVMLAQCARYVDALKTGCAYETDHATARIVELEAEVAALKQKIQDLHAPSERAVKEALAECAKWRLTDEELLEMLK